MASNRTLTIAQTRRRRGRPPSVVGDLASRGKLTIARVLAWADAYHALHGEWPTKRSGKIDGAAFKNWMAIDKALRYGHCGLASGSSLARLFAAERGVSRRHVPPLPKLPSRERGVFPQHRRRPLTVSRLLAWADAYRARHGKWPTRRSGPIDGVPGATWLSVDRALRLGLASWSTRSSLARLLAADRGVRRASDTRLTLPQILAWADAYHARHRRWPTSRSGCVDGLPGETWKGIDSALRQGRRSLRAGSSLALLLAGARGAPAPKVGLPPDAPRVRAARHDLPVGGGPRLSVRRILHWADTFHQRHGRWPSQRSGTIDGAPDLTWAAVHQALYRGFRGLPGGGSLAQLLADERGARPVRRLSLPRILAWADAFHARHGRWPSRKSGPVEDAPELNWDQIDAALRFSRHGLAGGSSLAQMLQVERDARKKPKLPPLDVRRVLAWADAYRARHGRWPARDSGPIDGVPGETWSKVEAALCFGLRGLPDGGSLARLLAAYRHAPRVPEDD